MKFQHIMNDRGDESYIKKIREVFEHDRVYSISRGSNSSESTEGNYILNTIIRGRVVGEERDGITIHIR